MSKPRGMSLLLIGPRLVGRADFDPAGALGEARVTARPGGSDALSSLEAALAMGGECGPVVYILQGGAFAHSLALPPAQTAGMGEAQLARALAYEVEPYSGIPAAESSVGFVASGPGNFAVLQIPRTEQEFLIERARAAGARQVLVTAPPEGQVREPTPETAGDWFTSAAKAIAAGAWPVIAAPAKAARSLAPREIMLVSLAAAFAILLAGRAVASQFLERARERDAACSRDAAEVAAARKQSESARKQSEELEAVAAARAAIERGRQAIHATLHGLAEKRTANLVVRSIDGPAPFQLRVRGIALSPGDVDRFGLALEGQLAPAGWTVVPDGTVALHALADGGPWEFSLALRHALGSAPADPDNPGS